MKDIMKRLLKNTLGFTLIEISISLVIVALIVAGITSAKSLKHNYELKILMDDVSKLNAAFHQFKTMHEGLPGDLWNADTKLGVTAGQVGNGDDIITNSTSEPVLALLHLSKAGLIKGEYTGSWTVATNNVMPGPTVSSKYYFGSISRTAAGVRTIFDGSTNESMIVVSNIYDSTANGTIVWLTETTFASVSAKDLYKIDSKYDDGYPTTGLIIGADAIDTGISAGACVNTTPTPNVYVSTTDTLVCYFGVIIDRKMQSFNP
jgi:prepilin-type N-terminal cleavage/methylation domain-containing protein